MEREAGIGIIREALADCLDLEIDAIHPESRLIPDLGADSLDFVDLIFTLERKFGVKIREGELDFFSRLERTLRQDPQEEFLSPAAIDALRPWLPALDQVADAARITPAELFSWITVETMWLLVKSKLSGSLPGPCT